MNRATAIIAGVLLVAVMVSCWIASYYQGKSEKLESTVKQLQSDNSLQATIIATQAFQFQRANEISRANTYEKQQIQQSSEATVIYIREKLSADECATRRIPDDVVNRLRQHTDKIRSTSDTSNSR